MAFNIYYLDIVKSDIKEAKDWYKKQKPGLEKDFAREVRKCIIRLQENPLAYEIKYRHVRTAFTEVFPYAIHFYMDESSKSVVVFAILHQTRNPKISKKRSKK